MAFPVSPNNGDKANVNGVTYTYSSSLSAWTVTSNFLDTFTGNALIANSATIAGELSSTTIVSGNVLPSANVAYNLGNTDNRWNELYLAGSTLYLGDIIMKNTEGNTVEFFGADGTTPATVSSQNIEVDSASISNGTSSLSIATENGNITATVNDVLVSTIHASGLIVGGNITANTIVPSANATHDLGTASLRWSTVYTSDLDLNNGIGDWTIVEGEDDLFLYNNRKGKVYKFALIEVDPSQATPKIDRLR